MSCTAVCPGSCNQTFRASRPGPSWPSAKHKPEVGWAYVVFQGKVSLSSVATCSQHCQLSHSTGPAEEEEEGDLGAGESVSKGMAGRISFWVVAQPSLQASPLPSARLLLQGPHVHACCIFSRESWPGSKRICGSATWFTVKSGAETLIKCDPRPRSGHHMGCWPFEDVCQQSELSEIHRTWPWVRCVLSAGGSSWEFWEFQLSCHFNGPEKGSHCSPVCTRPRFCPHCSHTPVSLCLKSFSLGHRNSCWVSLCCVMLWWSFLPRFRVEV